MTSFLKYQDIYDLHPHCVPILPWFDFENVVAVINCRIDFGPLVDIDLTADLSVLWCLTP